MIRTVSIALAASAFVASAAGAGSFSELIDLSGAESEGLLGAGSNTVIVVGVDAPGQTVTAFAWLLSFEAFSPSWGSEASIDITSPSGTTFTFDETVSGWTDSSGTFVDGGDTTAFDGESADGDWTFTFYESFDDAATDPDGIYDIASFVIKGVPAPGALALLGVAGFAARRRRRG